MIRSLCLGLTLAALASQAGAARVDLAGGGVMVLKADAFFTEPEGREAASCLANAPLAARADLPDGRGVAGIRAIDERVKDRFVYKADAVEAWDSHATHVLRHAFPALWAGDCDDLAITAMAVALCAGADPRRVGLLVFDATDDRPAHMMAVFIDGNGKSWIFGDTLGRMRPFRVREGASTIWVSADELRHPDPRWTEIG